MIGDILSYEPAVDVDMLIRRPVSEVYDAFVNPNQIRRFWLASSSGPLRAGAQVTWQFKIAGARTDVEVVEATQNCLLDLRWNESQPLRIDFDERGDGTVVHIRVTDFRGESPAADAIESMSGFTLVLASLKNLLEHGIEGDVMYDKFPDAEYADR